MFITTIFNYYFDEKSNYKIVLGIISKNKNFNNFKKPIDIDE